MKIIDMNAQALANTARELIERLPKMKMVNALNHWNLCVEQSGFAGTYGLPVVAYTRKSGIRISLERIAVQLERIAEGRHPLTNQTFDEAHNEALAMDDEINHAKSNAEMEASAISITPAEKDAHQERVEFWYHCQDVRDALVAGAHTEALELDEGINYGLLVLCDEGRQDLFDLLNDHSKCLLVNACHAAALKMDEAHDISYRSVSYPGCFEGLGSNQKRRAVAAAHAEALEMDANMKI